MKIEIKKNKKEHNEFAVKMTVTEGAILTVYHALKAYNTPIAQDLISFLEYAERNSELELFEHD